MAGFSLFIMLRQSCIYLVTKRMESIPIRRVFNAKDQNIEISFYVGVFVLFLIDGIMQLNCDMCRCIKVVDFSTLISIILDWMPTRVASKKELIDNTK